MQNNEIPVSYFYQIFCEQCRKDILGNQSTKIGRNVGELDFIGMMFEFFETPQLSKEEQLGIYDKNLFDICTNYITLSNIPIDILPNDVFELLELILNNMIDSEYQEGFLISLEFIYRDYLNYFGKGFPMLMSSHNSCELSSFKIVLNSRYELLDFEAVNMGLIEQCKIMNKIVMMETKNQIGPIPKVFIYTRNDI